MFVVQVLPSAEADVAQIRDCYEQQAELGEAFVTEFESLLRRLRQLPERFPEVREDIRRSLFGRFPYALYFRIQGNCVDVLAVLHSRSGPKKIAKALK